MEEYPITWFTASLFGVRFAGTLTAAEYEFALAIAENELANVKCWCPKVYPAALSIKISLLLDAAGVGLATGAAPTAGAATGTQDAYVIEDEVFDVRRKYKLVTKDAQVVSSSPAAQLGRILITCKPPFMVGAFLAGGIGRATNGCCSGPADKTVTSHGH